MTLPLPVDGRSLTQEQREALKTRRVRSLIVPVGDLDFSWMAEYPCNLHLLSEGVLQLTLLGVADDDHLMEAVVQSSINPAQFRQWLTHRHHHQAEPAQLAPVRYAGKLYERLTEAWRLSRFGDATLPIYEAHLQRFVGDALAIEVTYRDLPPGL